MPDIPQLPTDSFYKFIAMFGLLISLSSIIAPLVFINDSSDKTIKLYELVSNHTEKKSAVSAATGSDTATINTFAKQNIPDEINVTLQGIQKAQNFVMLLCNIGFLFGVGLSLIGFYFWYIRQQIYQDILAMRQAGREPPKNFRTVSQFSYMILTILLICLIYYSYHSMKIRIFDSIH